MLCEHQEWHSCLFNVFTLCSRFMLLCLVLSCITRTSKYSGNHLHCLGSHLFFMMGILFLIPTILYGVFLLCPNVCLLFVYLVKSLLLSLSWYGTLYSKVSPQEEMKTSVPAAKPDPPPPPPSVMVDAPPGSLFGTLCCCDVCMSVNPLAVSLHTRLSSL